MEIDNNTLKGIIDRLNTLEHIQVRQQKLLDQLEKMLSETNGNKFVNL